MYDTVGSLHVQQITKIKKQNIHDLEHSLGHFF